MKRSIAAGSAPPVRWPDPIRGPWNVTIDLEEQGGRLVCSGLAIRALPHTGGVVSGTLMRSLKVEELTRRAINETLGLIKSVEELGSPRAAARAARQRPRFEPQRGRRRDDDHYREVARIYAEALRRHMHPTEAVRTHEDWGPISRSTASKWVARARELGYLTPTEERRAGGTFTEKPTRRSTQ